VATFRTDGDYLDGRRPSHVHFSSRREDALRRDFTINGMYYDPLTEEIYDDTGGQADLKNQLIRFIGEPEQRVDEDRLRLLRAIRFAIKTGFRIEAKSYDCLKHNASRINDIAQERIFDELSKILALNNPKTAFRLLFDTGLIDYILPEVKALKDVEQPPDYHPEGDVLEHTLLALSHLPGEASAPLRFATLLHDIGKPATQEITDRIRFHGHAKVGTDISKDILRRLNCSKAFSDQVLALIANHMTFIDVQKMKTSTLKRFMALDYFDDHLALHRADCLAATGNLENIDFIKKKRHEFEAESSLRPEPLITGKDLIGLGFSPGPKFKDILRNIETMQLEGELSSRDEAIKYLQNSVIKSI
jgi:putative nucleotidyltransferase with HDIG domain